MLNNNDHDEYNNNYYYHYYDGITATKTLNPPSPNPYPNKPPHPHHQDTHRGGTQTHEKERFITHPRDRSTRTATTSLQTLFCYQKEDVNCF